MAWCSKKPLGSHLVPSKNAEEWHAETGNVAVNDLVMSQIPTQCVWNVESGKNSSRISRRRWFGVLSCLSHP